MESNERFYRRRANEELAAADRAITAAARERRLQLAAEFLRRLDDPGRQEPAMFGWVGSKAVGQA